MAYKKIILIFLSFSFISCVQQSRVEFALGTVCSVTLFDQGKISVYKKVFSRIKEIEKFMSVNIPSSDISRINAAAGYAAVQVHEDTFNVIQRAVYISSLCGGAFDPTVGPLVSLWGIGSEKERVPSHNEIKDVLPLINWHNIELNSEIKSVYLKNKNMALDLGAIAKGYAADEAAKIIKDSGIQRAIIDLGGNILVLGEKKDKSFWKVGIQNPDKNRGETIGYLQITEKTVVTSGVYERYFEENEKHYHHIFNPADGYPAQNNFLSVTLITDVSMDADALSTAVFVLGYEDGINLINSISGIEGVFIFEDKSIITTSGANFILTDKSFYIKNQ